MVNFSLIKVTKLISKVLQNTKVNSKPYFKQNSTSEIGIVAKTLANKSNKALVGSRVELCLLSTFIFVLTL